MSSLRDTARDQAGNELQRKEQRLAFSSQETRQTGKILIILNDPPYGTERSYNGLRLGSALSARPGTEVRIFLMGDAAACVKSGQNLPRGFYNIEVMLQSLSRRNAKVGACASCLTARGISDDEMTGGVHRSSLNELTDWCLWADRIIVF
ncbi:MAG: DsrE/DsrF/TusD sulfur relay family protein [bacterium]